MRRFAGLAAAVVAATVMVACGDDGGGSAESPEAWVDSVCEAGTDLAEEVTGVGETFQELASTFEGSRPSPDEIGPAFAGMGEGFADMREAFEDFAADIRSLGPPPVEGGEEFFDELTGALDEGVERLAEVTGVFEGLDEDMTLDELAQVMQEMEEIGDPGAALGDPFESLDRESPGNLDELMEESETCQDAEQRFDRLGDTFEEL